MNPWNRKLRETFFFSSRDLLANRAGQLSARQQARQGAAGISIKYGIVFFVIVMLGSLGVIAFFSSATGANEGAARSDTLITGGIVVGVVALILIVSLFSSRKHLAATRAKLIQKAEGEAQVGKIRADAAHFEIKIGRTKIRLLTQEQLETFKMGERYRLYYLPGPTPTILSGEVLGTEAEANETLEPEGAVEEDVILQRHRNARPIVAVLAVLTLGIPLAAFAISSLPGVWRLLGMLGLLGAAFGFVAWALRRTGS
jgi:protein-S-isoprenylcysteine O-methyltransferase Ste14